MKKIIVLGLILSSFIYAKSCDLSNLTTLDRVENAQKCLINQLKDLDEYFVRYKKYHKSVLETLELLHSQSGNCRKWKKLYQRTKDDDYKISVDDCNKLYKKRSLQYIRVAKQYNRISVYYEKLKAKVEGLKLKAETLRQTADIVGR